MSNFLLDMALRAEGLNEAEIAKVEKDAPALAALIKTLIDARPLIEQSIALFQKASPTIEQAWVELATAGPDIMMIIGHIRTGTPIAPNSGPGTQAGGGIG